MEYSLLGRSNLKVSRISFGCMSLGDDSKENERIVGRAIELGINFFDTADMYQQGANEIEMGRLLKHSRKDIVLATKVGNVWRSDGSGWDWNPSKEHILKAVEESLVRLQTDHIDLYQLHGGTLEDPIDDTIDAFEQLQQAGKILHYGISSIRPNVIREYVRRSNIVSVMMQYGLLDQRPEESCLGLLHQHNIGVLTRGSLAKGLLVNKSPAPFLQYSASDVKQAADAIKNISGEQRSASQTALRFALAHPAVTTAVVGIRTYEQLEDAAKTTNSPLLTAAEMNALQVSIGVTHYEQHR